MKEWFFEQDSSGLQFGYSIKKELYHKKSKFQDIRIVETFAYGRMLIIDGFVMLTEFDEFVYHEMMSHIPLCYHSKPRRVLVIGGGDGGTVRELVKHQDLEEIILCEIDADVVLVSKKFFPKIASDLTDPRVKVEIADGINYVSQYTDYFDLIIVDSTDPIGPGEVLFTKLFYSSVAKALRKGGMMVAQSESPWAEASVLRRIHQNMKANFSWTRPYVGAIPSYPRGTWSWTLTSQENLDISHFNLERFAKVSKGLQYLTQNLVLNIFDIPAFFQKKLSGIISE